MRDGTIKLKMVIQDKNVHIFKKLSGKYIVPYFFEDGYENHVFYWYNSTESMEKMKELLGHFDTLTCVKFLYLETEALGSPTQFISNN